MYVEILDDDEWSEAVADRWVSFMSGQPEARICLPTGATPRPMYSLAARSLDLSSATVFLLDEFGLPAGDAARCDSMLQRDLLDHLATPVRTYHRLDVDADDAGAEAARFDSLVNDGGLDLTMLGLGGNGHLGLNEPGSLPDSPTRAVQLASTTMAAVARYDGGLRPDGGLTLGLGPILESDAIWLLVSGLHKAEILGTMMSGSITADVPASFLRNHPNATVFADRSAASLL